ncbi:Hypothetical predicted protein [Olea europaea subsp. europaea]|uniref:Uncharacterized protein n=1 Tax=Olea europaea subsp. europaea TaxID=158383 RepID=A0A8S0VHH7_OLEEU|nr:Hypothetical predicted protein [Olea europaea subsp. europaea]
MGGVGFVTHLSEDVVTNAFIDLESFGDGRKGTSFGVHANASVDTLPQPQWRKRKQVHMTESFQEPPDTDCLEAAMAQNPDELALKVAALEALETLLTVGGSLRSKKWRANVDDLLITVATNACKGGIGQGENKYFSLPYLSLGLELFRRGMLETGSRLVQFGEEKHRINR